MDLSQEISLPFWDKGFRNISLQDALKLYQVNSFFREIVLDLMKRGYLEQFYLSEFKRLYQIHHVVPEYYDDRWDLNRMEYFIYVTDLERIDTVPEMGEGLGLYEGSYTKEELKNKFQELFDSINDYMKRIENPFYFREVVDKIIELNDIPEEILEIKEGYIKPRLMLEIEIKTGVVELDALNEEQKEILEENPDDFVILLNKDRSNQQQREKFWLSLGWKE